MNKPKPKRTKKNLDEDYEKSDYRLVKSLEADSFFLGVILYEYYTRRELFEDPKNLAFEEAKVDNVIIWEHFDKSSHAINDKLSKNLVRRMLHRDRVKRGHLGNLMAHPYLK